MPIRNLTPAEQTEVTTTLPRLDTTVQNLLNQHAVSPVVQYRIQQSAYGRSVQMFVEQFLDANAINNNAPTRYQYNSAGAVDGQGNPVPAHGGHNAEEQEEETTRLRVVWKGCNQHPANMTARQLRHCLGRPLRLG